VSAEWSTSTVHRPYTVRGAGGVRTSDPQEDLKNCCAVPVPFLAVCSPAFLLASRDLNIRGFLHYWGTLGPRAGKPLDQ